MSGELVQSYRNLWADIMWSRLHWPLLVQGDGMPASAVLIGKSSLVEPADFFQANYRPETQLAGWERLRRHYAGSCRDFYAQVPCLQAPFADLVREEGRSFGIMLADPDGRFARLTTASSWDETMRALGPTTRFADARVALAKMEIVAAAYSREPGGAILFGDQLRGFLSPRFPLQPSSDPVETYVRAVAARGDPFSKILLAAELPEGGVTMRPFSRLPEAVRGVRKAEYLDDRLVGGVMNFLSGSDEERKALRQLLSSGRVADDLLPAIHADLDSFDEFYLRARSGADQLPGLISSRQEGLAKAAFSPSTDLARVQSLRTYLARFACAVAEPGKRAAVYVNQGVRQLIGLPVPQLAIVAIGIVSVSVFVGSRIAQQDLLS